MKLLTYNFFIIILFLIIAGVISSARAALTLLQYGQEIGTPEFLIHLKKKIFLSCKEPFLSYDK